MKYKDKYNMTVEQNKKYARLNELMIVHMASRFEHIETTLFETKAIIDGLEVSSVTDEDITTIVNLKRAWSFVTESSQTFDLDFEKQINAIVAEKDALVPGQLRSGQGGVDIGESETFIPPTIDEQQEETYLKTLMGSDRSTTDKALTLMYHNMRQQIFWDGNKRSATLAANKIMIDGGAGLINIPLDHWETWNTKLSDYYRSNNMTDIKEWTYENNVLSYY